MDKDSKRTELKKFALLQAIEICKLSPSSAKKKSNFLNLTEEIYEWLCGEHPKYRKISEMIGKWLR
jgi:hypothetical protein